jgi:hypothetical protein
MAPEKTSFLNASDTPYSDPLPGWERAELHRSLKVGQSDVPQDKKPALPGKFAHDGQVCLEKVPKTRLYDKVEKDEEPTRGWRPLGGGED